MAKELNMPLSSDNALAFAQDFAGQKKNEAAPAAEGAPRNNVRDPSKIKDPAWKSVCSKKIDNRKPLSLIELVDMALRNNPKTRQAWESTRVARAQERQAESQLYPQISASMQITRVKEDSNTANNDVDDYYYGPTVQLTYLLLDFGGRAFGIKGALEKILSADAQYNQSIQDLLRDTQNAYYGFYSARSSVAAKESDVENAKQDFEAAQARFNVGLSAKLDLLQSQSNYENSLYNLEGAKGDLENARAVLAQSIGVPADSIFEVSDPVREVPAYVNKEDVSLLIDEALKKRQDIAGLRAELKAQEAAARGALSALLPSLSVGGSAGKNNYKYYNVTTREEEDHEYSGFAKVNWDVFDGFNNLNKKIQADRERDIAFDQLVQAELALSADVWTKYYNFNTAVRKFDFSKAYLSTAQESYDIALESYKAGIKSMLDLTSAQAQLSEAKSQLIQSRKNVFTSLAELAHSTGSLNIKDYSVKD